MTGFLRGAALFLALFALASLFVPSHDPNLWWIDLRWLPYASVLIVITAAALMAFAFGRALRVAAIPPAITALLALVNTIVFYRLLFTGEIRSSFPVPFSLLVASLLIAVAMGHVRRDARGRAWQLAAGFVVTLFAFPILQVIAFGSTDYRRPADVAVVFGARAYANGEPSSALADRVRTACELYHAGLVHTLVFSGGPGDGPIDEPHAMLRLAASLGVPPAAIQLDPQGLNTDLTVRNTSTLCTPTRRILAVSHFYHLPRIKLAYARAGCDVLTVPSHLTHPTQLLYNVPREALAFWVYYWRGMKGGGVAMSAASGLKHRGTRLQ